MLKYILKRIGFMIVTLFVITVTTFYLMHTVPGDPLGKMAQRNLPPQVRANFEAKYGLNEPVHKQLFMFLKNFTDGDLGESIIYPGMKVTSTIKKNAPISAKIGFSSLVVGVFIGILFGIIAALNRNRWPDYVIIFLAIVGVTVPSFVLAPLLQYVFSVKLKLLPAYGWGSKLSWVLPMIALSFGTIATYARYMRSSVLEVINSDYILTAEAKGVSYGGVIRKHVLRNAIIPSLTILGGQISGIFAGSFVIEKIFSIPGLGFYLVKSVSDMDFPMIVGTTVFFGFLFLVAQLVVDILYGIVDPRIKLSED